MAKLLSQSCDLGARPSQELIVLQPCRHVGRRGFRGQGPDNVKAARFFKAVAERYVSRRFSPTSCKAGLYDHRRAT